MLLVTILSLSEDSGCRKHLIWIRGLASNVHGIRCLTGSERNEQALKQRFFVWCSGIFHICLQHACSRRRSKQCADCNRICRNELRTCLRCQQQAPGPGKPARFQNHCRHNSLERMARGNAHSGCFCHAENGDRARLCSNGGDTAGCIYSVLTWHTQGLGLEARVRVTRAGWGDC